MMPNGSCFARKLTFEDRAEIARLYRAGASMTKLAKDFSVARLSIRYHLRKAGVIAVSTTPAPPVYVRAKPLIPPGMCRKCGEFPVHKSLQSEGICDICGRVEYTKD